ncbi:other 1 protein kinase [Moniliophthora roreri]|uniref:Protein kinase domain-containing protein n=1 Tax=Moniliophthora roreri TaxID=221103 RepID=A0A0W0G8I1_MONRR|nr:other 1 protein kinase [Moniliophthora roreri]
MSNLPSTDTVTSFDCLPLPHLPLRPSPRTPQKMSNSIENSRISSINNTPYNHGSADHVSDKTKPTRDDFKPFLIFDVKGEKTVPLDLFIFNVLHISESLLEAKVSRALRSIEESNGFKELLVKYREKVSSEIQRYPTFVKLVNYAIGEMVEKKITTNERRFILAVNHPSKVRGSYSDRIPDTVGVTQKAISLRRLSKSDKETVQDTAKASPRVPFMWGDIFTFIEFKLEKYSLEGTDGHGSLNDHGEEKARISATPTASATDSSQCASRSSSSAPQPSHTETRTPAILSSEPMSRLDSIVSSSSKKRLRPDDEDDTEVSQVLKKARNERNTPLDIRIQCASYACEIFNRGGIRTHVLGGLVTDDRLELMIYTRSGSCRSAPFSFIQEPRTLLLILFALSTLSFSQWGIFDKLPTKSMISPRKPLDPHIPDCNMFFGRTLRLGGTVYKVEEIIMFPRGLVGRGTWIIRARSPRWPDMLLIIKLSSPATSRTAERKFIDAAREYVEKHPEHLWVLDHLPLVLDSGEVPLDEISFAMLFGDDFEGRELRFMVLEELKPITELIDAVPFSKAFKDTVKCYQWLVEHPKILHRDISVNNLMYRQKEDGTICGVLNDFDLSCFLKDHSAPTSRLRTGTKPFLARDLLVSPSETTVSQHYVRHDLESFFYVFAWIICRFHDGAEISSPPFQEWCDGSWRDVARVKLELITGDNVQSSKPTAKFTELEKAMGAMRYRFTQGTTKRLAAQYEDEPFDVETLGGAVTFEQFMKIFDKHFPAYVPHTK